MFALPTHQSEAWREVLMPLAEEESSSVVWVDEWAVTPVDYYDRQLQEDAGITLDWQPLLSRDLPDLPATQPQPGADLWLIMAEGPYRHLVRTASSRVPRRIPVAGGAAKPWHRPLSLPAPGSTP